MSLLLSPRILPNPSENNKGAGIGRIEQKLATKAPFTCVLHRLNRELSSDQRINGPSDQVRNRSFRASLIGAPTRSGERQRKGIGSVGHRWSVGRMVGWSDDSSRQSPIKRKCQVAIESSSCQIGIRCHPIRQQEPRIAPRPPGTPSPSRRRLATLPYFAARYLRRSLSKVRISSPSICLLAARRQSMKSSFGFF